MDYLEVPTVDDNDDGSSVNTYNFYRPIYGDVIVKGCPEYDDHIQDLACPKSKFAKPSMRSFNSNDPGMPCQDNFMMAEEGYAFQYSSYLEKEAEICGLM